MTAVVAAQVVAVPAGRWRSIDGLLPVSLNIHLREAQFSRSFVGVFRVGRTKTRPREGKDRQSKRTV